MYKKLMALALALTLALSLVACTAPSAPPAGSSAQGSASASSAEDSSQTAEPAAFPVTLTDAAGRTVTITQPPNTLVSGYYITTSLLIALGQQDKLVGIEAKADTRPIYALSAPHLLGLPNVGTAKAFDLEGCAALKPELIVLPIKLKDSVPALEDLGLSVLLVNPESLEQLTQTITLLGAATGASEQAEALVDYYQNTTDFLTTTLSAAPRPTVYLAGNSSYLSTAGASMYQNALLELGGGTNVAAALTDSYWADISYEQLLAWNPAVIVICADAAYSKDDLLQDPQLSQLEAVQSGRVYAMPSAFESWDSPVPSTLVGSRWIASVLHEDRYSFADFSADASGFYQQFYGLSIDQSLLTQ